MQLETVVTPGNHDGVHCGHRALLASAQERATRENLTVTVLTFDPHPASIVAPERVPPRLTTLERRTALLKALGADHVVVQRFDRTFASMSPDAFVNDVLISQLKAKAIVIGPDFRFGKDRAGDGPFLKERGAHHGFDVINVAPIQIEGAPVSSTRIRHALQAGDLPLATTLLKRVHDVGGTVIRGDQRGRTIGFPTANLACEDVLLPSDGVYSVVARLENESRILRGVANLGIRPTVNAGRSVEVHFFDFADDIYEKNLRVGFVSQLREEIKFESLDALKQQIHQDSENAKEALAAADEATWQWI